VKSITSDMRGLLTAGLILIAPAALPAQSLPAQKLPSWSDQIDQLRTLGDELAKTYGRDDTPARRQEMNKYVLGAVADGYLNYVNQDPAHPTWSPLWNHALNYGGPNPDYAYMSTQVVAQGVYRISGYRGTNSFVEITQMSPEFARTDIPTRTLATNDLDQLKIGKNRAFSLILSAERPKDYRGDWWPLKPETRMLLMRKTAVDWRKEIDPRIAIARLDQAAADTPEAMAARFSQLRAFAAGIIEMDSKLARFYRDKIGINVIKVSPLRKADNVFPGQVYLDGAFEIADDEALIVETKLPRTCRYWQILVADDRFATIDWLKHQSSLNAAQARIDKDGYFRAVISARDPGVPNWLDTAGEPWGIMQMRWNRCSESPEPIVRKVLLKDVRRSLPSDTLVVTPAQRLDQLMARREAAQLRQLW
jgi:hypothetical protein